MAIIAGKYEVIRTLGEGSSGKVVLARHIDLNLEFAIKILNKALSEDERFLTRFKREAEVLLRFTHQGSIQLRDFGKTDEGQYYLAMDFCHGEILKELLAREGRLSFDRSFNILFQILSVLDAAHGHGIVHRDVKPENIMIEMDNRGQETIKIVDFGIAKVQDTDVLNSGATIDGVSIGTPSYMSPEQAAGERNLDHRADIYAAGIVAYELFSGAPPFVGQTVVETMIMQLTRPPEPFAAELQIAPELEAIIFKALAKKPDERFQTAQLLLDALRNVKREMQGVPEPAAAAPQTHLPSPPPAGDVTPTNVTKILCLDDSEMILHIMSHILEAQGYQVFTASNSAAIHGYIFGERVDLMISDINMPDIPGTKVCRMLKDSVKNLKIMLFSNIDERDLIRASEESNADGWISKNSKPNEWLLKINEVLGRES